MKLATRSVLGALFVTCLCIAPSFAAGPIDGEVGAVYWASESEVSAAGSSASADSDAPGFRAELWFMNRFGGRAGVFQSDYDVPNADSSDYTAIDLLWRPYSPSENSFVAVGLGWQQMDLGSTLDFADDTSGARVSVEGRVGVGPVYLYGQGAYLPTLDDAPAMSGGRYEEMAGYEAEAGASWSFAPFVALRGGYRLQNVEFEHSATPGVKAEAESDGLFAGLTFRF